MEKIIKTYAQTADVEKKLVISARSLCKAWKSEALVQDSLLDVCTLNLNLMMDESPVKIPDFEEEIKMDLHALRGLRNPISRYFKYLKIVWAIYGWLIVP